MSKVKENREDVMCNEGKVLSVRIDNSLLPWKVGWPL